MEPEVKIKVSLGLVALVLLGAFAENAFDRLLNKAIPTKQASTLPLPRATSIVDNGLLPQPVITATPSVNQSALNEVKQQSGRKVYNSNTGEFIRVPELAKAPTEAPKITADDRLDLERLKADSLSELKTGRWVRSQQTGEVYWCKNCDPIAYPTVAAPSVAQPMAESQLSRVAREANASLRSTADGKLYCYLNDPGLVWSSTGQRGTHAFPQNQSAALIAEVTAGSRPFQAASSILEPSAVTQSQPMSAASPKAFELALFLDDSQRSQTIRQWFNTDADLKYIRSQCNFQIYTPDNPIYRTRFANVVSTANFPALLLTFADGGHIHAAAENMIPSTSQMLASDLYYYATLAADGRRAEAQAIGAINQSGAMKTHGYSWDKAITPSMQLMMAPDQISDRDCVDTDGDGVCDEPGQGEGFIARARARAQKSAVAWFGPSDYAAIALGAVVFLLAFAFARKQGYF